MEPIPILKININRQSNSELHFIGTRHDTDTCQDYKKKFTAMILCAPLFVFWDFDEDRCIIFLINTNAETVVKHRNL